MSTAARRRNRLALLIFVTSTRSGPARRMDSVLAHLARKERHRLRVTRVDFDEQRRLARALGVREVPTLVLVRNGREVARLEGRSSAPQIEEMLAEHLPEVAVAA